MPSTSCSGRDPGPVVFLDSGIGGLPYLELARERLPGVPLAYVADTAHFPYGRKSARWVTEAVLQAARAAVRLLAPRAVVLACNTASVVALSSLRREVAVPVVGTVPAVRPAAALTESGRVGVLATRRTLRASYLRDLIQRFAGDCRVELVAASGIVDFVEKRLLEASPGERLAVAQCAARRLRGRRVDVVVLACTHFLHLEAELREALGPGIALVDSRDGVVRQLARVLESVGGSTEGSPAAPRLYVTRADGSAERYRQLCARRGMEFAGELE